MHESNPFLHPPSTALFVLAEVAAAPGDDMTAVAEAAVYSDEPFLALVRKYTIDGGEKVDYAAPALSRSSR